MVDVAFHSSEFKAASCAGHRMPVGPTAVQGHLGDLLCLLGSTPDYASCAIPIAQWQARTGAVLFHEGSAPTHLYIVRAGTFKCFKTSEEGYEQVLAFRGAGSVLGFEALYSGREVETAVALEDSRLYALALGELNGWRRQSAALDQGLQRALSAQLVRASEYSHMMAAVAAEVRLARFLMSLSMAAAERGHSPRRLMLRMNRREIASLLGVAHETISRAFGLLANAGLVSVHKREIEILDLPALKDCARDTRRPHEEEDRVQRAAIRSAAPSIKSLRAGLHEAAAA